MALPLCEFHRKAKDEFSQKLMEEMKIKNEAIRQRYAEVEEDRIKAEAKNTAVTSLKVSKKENAVIGKETAEDNYKITKEREWDKGKIYQGALPKFYGHLEFHEKKKVGDILQITKERESDKRKVYQSAKPKFYGHREFHEKEKVEDILHITKREWDRGKIYQGPPPKFYIHREFHEKEKVEDILQINKESEWDKGKIYQAAPPKFYLHREFHEKEKVEDSLLITKERESDKRKVYQGAPPKFYEHREFQEKEKVEDICKIPKERKCYKWKIYEGSQSKLHENRECHGKDKLENILETTKEREWDKEKTYQGVPPKYPGYHASVRKIDVEQLTNTKESSALSDILFSVHESYKKCLKVYGPIVQKSEMFYHHYRTIFDTMPDKHFLLFLSQKLIKITYYMVSIQISFEKIDKELQFIYVIIDNFLTSAVEFFFESARRILDFLSSVNDLMTKCVNELEAIQDRVKKTESKELKLGI